MASCENSITREYEKYQINKKALEILYLSYIDKLWREPSYSQSIKNCSFKLRETVDDIIAKLKNADIDNPKTYFSFGAGLLHFVQEECIKNIEFFNSSIKTYINEDIEMSFDDKKKLIGFLPN